MTYVNKATNGKWSKLTDSLIQTRLIYKAKEKEKEKEEEKHNTCHEIPSVAICKPGPWTLDFRLDPSIALDDVTALTCAVALPLTYCSDQENIP